MERSKYHLGGVTLLRRGSEKGFNVVLYEWERRVGLVIKPEGRETIFKMQQQDLRDLKRYCRRRPQKNGDELTPEQFVSDLVDIHERSGRKTLIRSTPHGDV